MTIISADYLLVCDKAFTIHKNMALCFDETIREIGTIEDLKTAYPDAKVVMCAPHTLLMPGLINVHVHLEFSANKTTLHYGDFIPWLQSVITHRDTLSSACGQACIEDALTGMLKSGTTTIGAISSFGADLEACVKSPMNVVYFNEVLGSNPAAVDALYGDFLGRFYESLRFKSGSFIPSISVHSPYSTHPILAKKALEIAKKEDLIVSTHFMESASERAWLDNGEGDFAKFFAGFNPHAKPVNTGKDFLALFEGIKTLFTHACAAHDEEFALMNGIGSVTHCPVSNRLLGNPKLDITKVQNLTLATDGLSSNNSLSLWDEMRAALMLHHEAPLEALAQTLMRAVTVNAGEALGRNCGILATGYDADLITITLQGAVETVEALALMAILHTHEASSVYIKGVEMTPSAFSEALVTRQFK